MSGSRRRGREATRDPDEEVEYLDTAQQEKMVRRATKQQRRIEEMFATSFGLLAVTLTLLLVYVATALITEPWSLTHVNPLRAIASETEIFLSLGILIVITVLSGVAFTPWGTFGLLNVAMVLAVIPFCLWTTLFLYHGVWLPWLLWLPLGGPVLVAFLKFFANEIVEGREEVEKFRALQYKFHKA